MAEASPQTVLVSPALCLPRVCVWKLPHKFTQGDRLELPDAEGRPFVRLFTIKEFASANKQVLADLAGQPLCCSFKPGTMADVYVCPGDAFDKQNYIFRISTAAILMSSTVSAKVFLKGSKKPDFFVVGTGKWAFRLETPSKVVFAEVTRHHDGWLNPKGSDYEITISPNVDLALFIMVLGYIDYLGSMRSGMGGGFDLGINFG